MENSQSQNTENSQLQNLMNYTVFHIGAYISLLGVILGIGTITNINTVFFKVSFICYLIAGACGGVIASSIPEYASFTEFSSVKIGFWRMRIFRYKTWAFIEHFVFWIGTLWIALTFIFFGTKYFYV